MPSQWSRRRTGWTALATAAALLWSGTAFAIYLDPDQNISLRGRFYSQLGIRVSEEGDTGPQTVPKQENGHMMQHRNFYNPELDAKLTDYFRFLRSVPALSWLEPDDFRFRVAAWGFYDGIYDYGPDQWGDIAFRVNRDCCDEQALGPLPAGERRRAWFLEGPSFNPDGGTFDRIFEGHEVKNIRDEQAHRHRVNELYLSYSKGPMFLRVGRQFISWGEADTIALLDQQNPFDITAGAPGLFQDLEESRIPLWTVRASMNLFDTLGPLSSGFVEAYWVPGDIDIDTGIVPVPFGNPLNVGGGDPQDNPQIPPSVQFVLLDRIPKKRFSNSRYGFRFQTVVNRFLTLQAWLYTTFQNAPVPRAAGVVPTDAGTPLFVTETIHDLISVYGLAGTFFVEAIDSIMRIEFEYFENEPGFIPEFNLRINGVGDLRNPNAPPGMPFGGVGTVPVADILRWEIGFDRFFFFRALNPTNSFTLSASTVGAFNFDETDHKDFRMNGQMKPGFDVTTQSQNAFVQSKQFETFFNVALLTDYMHGRLSPRLVLNANIRGTYFVNPTLTYRWSDYLLFQAAYVHIGGEFQGVGFYRDRDILQLRITAQLN